MRSMVVLQVRCGIWAGFLLANSNVVLNDELINNTMNEREVSFLALSRKPSSE